jgi:DNA repair exonuclease SbcCD ATPase subunit
MGAGVSNIRNNGEGFKVTEFTMQIRFISFIGPKKKIAKIKFGSGLNLIFGPSNTGKSSVLDALDFMLGRERALKEIPQHEGYDQVLLGIEFSNEEKFTFIRSISGGDYECFEGLHDGKPKDQQSTVLRPKKGTQKVRTISEFLLTNLGLNEKKLKKNADNKTVSLTLRNFLPIAMVTETNIQKEASPYIGEQYIEKTEHRSRLKLLLTGVDDSALLPAEIEKKRLSRTAKIDILEELINDQERSISDNLSNNESLEELNEQKGRLTDSIQQKRNLLDSSEVQYSLFVSDRTQFRSELEQNNERLSEISEMLSRFGLLKAQYRSDILRLESISEAGSLINALPSGNCPLCGSQNTEVSDHVECDGNLSEIVLAASAEQKKIDRMQVDLKVAMSRLVTETTSIEGIIPGISDSITSVNKKISQLNPDLNSQRTKYTELLSVKNKVDKYIGMFEYLDSLKIKKVQLEKEAPNNKRLDEKSTSLPTSALFNLSKAVKGLLENWNFPDSGDIHFDNETEDFVVNGKHRASNGKGHRAITHAAATLGLMKYTEENKMPHLGFTIIDSPLLAYEEPENEADDLSATDVNVKFLDSLAAWGSRQVIVFENKKSIPKKYISGDQVIHFTGGKEGRYGFFPTNINE